MSISIQTWLHSGIQIQGLRLRHVQTLNPVEETSKISIQICQSASKHGFTVVFKSKD